MLVLLAIADFRFRQIEPNRRSYIRRAFDLCVAAGLLGESVDHAEPEPRALAHFLGRKKRFETRGNLDSSIPVPVLDIDKMT